MQSPACNSRDAKKHKASHAHGGPPQLGHLGGLLRVFDKSWHYIKCILNVALSKLAQSDNFEFIPT